MVKVFVYVEGGGDTRALRDRCRRAFSRFFEKAGLSGRLPHVVACGTREATWKRFRSAHATRVTKEAHVLLVDSEAPVDKSATNWGHLHTREKWDRPEDADEDSAQLMVQCMEAWFLADRETLKAYFGQGFADSKLPNDPDVEGVAKNRIMESLKQATRETKTKGRYDKGEHSFAILELLDAVKVVRASRHAESLISVLRRKSTAESE